MTLNEEAKLLVVTNSKNDNGFVTDREVTEYPVFVQEKSVTRAEFYDALRANINVKTVLLAWYDDWELTAHKVGDHTEYATQVEYGGNTYNIVRTYRDTANKSLIEIVCS